MRCPFCNAEKESLKVIDSRTCDGGRSIRRRRECLSCTKRFTTYERIEENVRLTVVKRDGRRVPWDRNKIVLGLERACFKRPVPESELIRLADEALYRSKQAGRDRCTLGDPQLVGPVGSRRERDQGAVVDITQVARGS